MTRRRRGRPSDPPEIKALKEEFSNQIAKANARLRNIRKKNAEYAPAYRAWEANVGRNFSTGNMKTENEIRNEMKRVDWFLDLETSLPKAADDFVKGLGERTNRLVRGFQASDTEVEVNALGQDDLEIVFDVVGKYRQQMKNDANAYNIGSPRMFKEITNYTEDLGIELGQMTSADIENFYGYIQSKIDTQRGQYDDPDDDWI